MLTLLLRAKYLFVAAIGGSSTRHWEAGQHFRPGRGVSTFQSGRYAPALLPAPIRTPRCWSRRRFETLDAYERRR